jgi:[acyl-carrier-protein] S-malonyltransferase
MKSFADQGIKQIVECGAGNVLANLAKRMPYGFDVFPIDTRGRLDQALTAVSLAEGKIA